MSGSQVMMEVSDVTSLHTLECEAVDALVNGIACDKSSKEIIIDTCVCSQNENRIDGDGFARGSS